MRHSQRLGGAASRNRDADQFTKVILIFTETLNRRSTQNRTGLLGRVCQLKFGGYFLTHGDWRVETADGDPGCRQSSTITVAGAQVRCEGDPRQR
jgi:hypothetical protein